MQATELRLDISLADPDIRRTERHQFVNLIHVIHAELQLIERIAGTLGAFRDEIRLCETAIQAFSERNTAIGYRDELIGFRDRIVSLFTGFTAECASDQDASDIDDARRVVLEMMDAADVRVQGILARHEVDRPWTDVAATEILGAHGSFTGGNEIRVPAGLDSAIRRFVSTIDNGTKVSVAIATTAGVSSVVSVTRPGVALPGTEFTSDTRIDFEALRSDPDQAAKLALLGVYFIVVPHGSVSFSTNASPNDTLLVAVNPVA